MSLCLAFLLALSSLAPHDPVDAVYMKCPDLIVRAIRHAEGVPSYGILTLARQYGGDHRKVPESVGRASAARLLHRIHASWRTSGGRVDSFLAYLSHVWAPVGVANDPTGLNRYWKRNVQNYVAGGCR